MNFTLFTLYRASHDGLQAFETGRVNACVRDLRRMAVA
jgi:hypothetical protein